MILKKILVLLLTFIQVFSQVYFSTKTAYEEVANLNILPLIPANYDVAYIRYIGRHGSRYPGSKDMKAVHSTIDFITKFSPNYKEYFDPNSFAYTDNFARALSPNGIKQLYLLGQRYRERLKDMFDSPNMKAYNFKFESSCRSRSIQSMISFSAGMFPIKENIQNLPHYETMPCSQDFTYRFFDFCKRYTEVHKCNDYYQKEKSLFFEGSLVNKISMAVSEKLQLPQDKRLTPHSLLSLYLLCAYNISIYNGGVNEGVCSIFNEEAFRAFDYLLDIKNFYRRGNFLRINILVSCPLFDKIYDSILIALETCPRHCSFHESSECVVNPSGDLGFAHAETLIPILGFFGLLGANGNDYLLSDPNIHLTEKNYRKLAQDRIFKGGYLSPMGGHIMFVVACPSNGLNEGAVMAVLNERPIRIPCCEGYSLEGNSSYPACTKEQFIKCFEDLANKCDFLGMCSEEYTCENK